MKFTHFIYFIITKVLSVVLGSHVGRNTIIRFPLSKKGAENINIGNNCFIGKNSRLYCFKSASVQGKIKIGNNFNAQRNLYLSSLESITIGNNVLIGSDVMIIDNDHVVKPGIVGFPGLVAKSINIEENVWIAEKSCILKGVTIGKYSIIGAGSVVTRTIPPYSIVVGNPARVIKTYNFTNQEWEANG